MTVRSLYFVNNNGDKQNLQAALAPVPQHADPANRTRAHIHNESKSPSFAEIRLENHKALQTFSTGHSRRQTTSQPILDNGTRKEEGDTGAGCAIQRLNMQFHENIGCAVQKAGR